MTQEKFDEGLRELAIDLAGMRPDAILGRVDLLLTATRERMAPLLGVSASSLRVEIDASESLWPKKILVRRPADDAYENDICVTLDLNAAGQEATEREGRLRQAIERMGRRASELIGQQAEVKEESELQEMALQCAYEAAKEIFGDAIESKKVLSLSPLAGEITVLMKPKEGLSKLDTEAGTIHIPQPNFTITISFPPRALELPPELKDQMEAKIREAVERTAEVLLNTKRGRKKRVYEIRGDEELKGTIQYILGSEEVFLACEYEARKTLTEIMIKKVKINDGEDPNYLRIFCQKGIAAKEMWVPKGGRFVFAKDEELDQEAEDELLQLSEKSGWEKADERRKELERWNSLKSIVLHLSDPEFLYQAINHPSQIGRLRECLEETDVRTVFQVYAPVAGREFFVLRSDQKPLFLSALGEIESWTRESHPASEEIHELLGKIRKTEGLGDLLARELDSYVRAEILGIGYSGDAAD